MSIRILKLDSCIYEIFNWCSNDKPYKDISSCVRKCRRKMNGWRGTNHEERIRAWLATISENQAPKSKLRESGENLDLYAMRPISDLLMSIETKDSSVEKNIIEKSKILAESDVNLIGEKMVGLFQLKKTVTFLCLIEHCKIALKDPQQKSYIQTVLRRIVSMEERAKEFIKIAFWCRVNNDYRDYFECGKVTKKLQLTFKALSSSDRNIITHSAGRSREVISVFEDKILPLMKPADGKDNKLIFEAIESMHSDHKDKPMLAAFMADIRGMVAFMTKNHIRAPTSTNFESVNIVTGVLMQIIVDAWEPCYNI